MKEGKQKGIKRNRRRVGKKERRRAEDQRTTL